MNYGPAIPGNDPSLQTLGMFGSSKSAPKIEALTKRVDELEEKMNSHESKDNQREEELQKLRNSEDQDWKNLNQYLARISKQINGLATTVAMLEKHMHSANNPAHMPSPSQSKTPGRGRR